MDLCIVGKRSYSEHRGVSFGRANISGISETIRAGVMRYGICSTDSLMVFIDRYS